MEGGTCVYAAADATAAGAIGVLWGNDVMGTWRKERDGDMEKGTCRGRDNVLVGM